MSLIKILDSSLVELATINKVLSAALSEKINSDKTLSFSLPLTEETSVLINDTNVIGLGTDYFDIAKYQKSQSGGGLPTVSVECEHISYRLNNAEYNVEFFTEIGTPTEILTAILEGTDLEIGTIDFDTELTYSAQEAKSRRALLMELVATLEGEVQFDGFTVSILAQRGNVTPQDLTANKNITVISKSVDKRTLDSLGNPTYSYQCSLGDSTNVQLGDVVILDYALLDIDVSLRVVSITTNPYDARLSSFEVGNYINALEDDLYRIETETVSKDALYNGCRIGPEFGFEAVRNDKKARAFLCSDKLALQAGDGSGTTWTDKLYYDYDSETGEAILVFDGMLSADVINASSALITQSLSAETGTIAELTVDRLETSTKVKNYLNENTADVNYIKAYEQYIQWITASTDGTTTEQAVNRSGELLYWLDETHLATTTTESEYPVTIYVYTEMIKAELSFNDIGSGVYAPQLVLGVGSDPASETKGKAIIYKGVNGLEINYHHSNYDTLRQITLSDDGAEVVGNTGTKGIRNIAIGSTEPISPQNNDLWIDTEA